MEWIVLLAAALFAGTLGGIVGFGSGVIMVPILAFVFGPKEAVPIMAIASLFANTSRVAVWWRELDLKASLVYCATAIPAAVAGATTFIRMDANIVEGFLGVFLLAMIPVRRWLLARHWKLQTWHFALVGAGIGFLTGIVASTGPINAPFFLAYGLTKGAYIATEAFGSAAVSLTKSIVFGRFGALSWESLVRGAIVGSALMIGSYIAKGFVQRMNPKDFTVVMDILLAIAGIAMVTTALR
jgi:hypothetical protein